MGRRKNDGSEIIIFIIMCVIAAPFVLIKGVGKLIKAISIEAEEKKEQEKLKKIQEEKDKKIEEFNKELEKQKQRECIIKSKEFNYINYYDNLMNKEIYKEYISKEKPTLELIKQRNNCLKKNNFLEKINKERKSKRLRQEKECEKILQECLIEFDKKEKTEKEKYEEQKRKFESKIDVENEEILKRKEKFINRDENEVQNVLNEYLRIKLKEIYCKETYSTRYFKSSQLCIVEYKYKNLDSIQKFDKQLDYFNQLVEMEVPEKERIKRYKEYMYKDALRMLDLVFSFDKGHIKNIVFNGYVNTLNHATGYNEDFIVLSVKVSQEEFIKINLEKVDPKLCLEALNYRFVKNLSNIQAITPFETSIDSEKSVFSLKHIDVDMNGYEFEEISKELLLADGFENVKVTSSSGDFGADVIAYKNQIKYAIQCKKYSQPVGVKAVQEVMGSKSIYGCHVAVVLTNNTFTPQARTLAEKNNILLWDRIKLQELIENYKLQLVKNN